MKPDRVERARARSEARANQVRADLEQRSQHHTASAEAAKQAARARHEQRLVQMMEQRDKVLEKLEDVLPKCEQCKRTLIRCECKNKNLDK